MSELNTCDVLIIEDETDLLDRIEKIIKGLGFSTRRAESFQAGLSLLCTFKFRLIITDIQLPDANGIQILEWAKENSPITRVILMTGHLEDTDVNNALDLGVFGFLAKPLTKKELKKVVNNALSSNPADKISEDDFALVEIDDFICGKVLNFPVYIKLKDGRFLKIAHSGTEIDLDRIRTLKDKGIKDLWIEKEFLKDYKKLNELILQSKSQLSAPIKLQMVKHFTEITFENMRLFEINDETILECTNSIDDLIETVANFDNAYYILSPIMDGPPRTSQMAILGATYSLLLCRVLDWTSPKIIQNLALGALFRDVSLLQEKFDYSTLYQLPNDFKKEHYKEHPLRSKEILEEMSGIPSEVKIIVEQHHEDGSPNGFPHGLARSNIFQLAFLVNIIDNFLFKTYTFNLVEKDMTKTMCKYLEDHYGYMDEKVVALIALLKKKTIYDARLELNRFKKTSKF